MQIFSSSGLPLAFHFFFICIGHQLLQMKGMDMSVSLIYLHVLSVTEIGHRCRFFLAAVRGNMSVIAHMGAG